MHKATKKYTAHVIFWHRINVMVISGSLFTVFLNSTLLDKKSNAKFIAQQLEQQGASLTAQQAKAVAHGLEEKVWDWHVYVGYALIALLVYRLIAEFSQNSNQKLSQKIKKAFLLYRVQKDKSIVKELLVSLAMSFFMQCWRLWPSVG
ncbi:cytochrome b/b6 domain-containing protein [Pedobacter sp. SL55]|uniref:cytochrome b/b6 domain-containing protein n=1 Tax=Pedobacter sp. SL55 TaxID=2995161 RepID=UPI002270884C|nr:cytochrome b/b6 domain-containing protein [Pedobacter sp. SL55]WAC40501.1 cytochrome b/b6 domain-containing protein [Pedobacter sp. SL55]